MAHYLIAHLNEGRYGDAQILSGAGIDELHRPAAEINEMGMSLGHYGMGWISQETGESRIVSHSGIVPDFGAFMALVPEQKKGMVLLFNANHAMMKMTFDEVGMGAAQRLAGEPPAPSRFGAAPWAMRGMLLIPLLQIVGVVATLLLLRRWRQDPERRPSRGRMWGQHILLPLIPNLLVALTLIPMLSKMRGFLMLFMPDFSWIAMICGSFAVVWSFPAHRVDPPGPPKTLSVNRLLSGSAQIQSMETYMNEKIGPYHVVDLTPGRRVMAEHARPVRADALHVRPAGSGRDGRPAVHRGAQSAHRRDAVLHRFPDLLPGPRGG